MKPNLCEEHRAAKILQKSQSKKDEKLFELLLSEINILSKVDSPNVMKVIEIFESQKYYYIVTELLKGPTLIDFLLNTPKRGISEKILAEYIRQILSGICHCHSMNIVHRDIKPDNIIFTAESCTTLKLIDFGL